MQQSKIKGSLKKCLDSTFVSRVLFDGPVLRSAPPHGCDREGEVIFLRAGGNSVGSKSLTFVQRLHSGASGAVVDDCEYSLLLLAEAKGTEAYWTFNCEIETESYSPQRFRRENLAFSTQGFT